eukprot:1038801-Amphidinium_carterae.1
MKGQEYNTSTLLARTFDNHLQGRSQRDGQSGGKSRKGAWIEESGSVSRGIFWTYLQGWGFSHQQRFTNLTERSIGSLWDPRHDAAHRA